MIVFAFITFALLQLSNQQTVEQLVGSYVKLIEPVQADCIKESGVDPSVIEKEVSLGRPSEDPKSKCFWKCFLKKNNAINDNDEIQEENLKQIIAAPLVAGVYKKCAALRGSDSCDTADKISKCIYGSTKAAILN
ncbi:hypothetical protein ILUMI_02300 [Ignelater luminosus]|uniref:Uncharacterized protein n=1 Tax=Ignelater luminosus TaxID=2038154 RepID=A0A8K0GJE5_IGNLU|nr:hypothetical protein ILUMI_02300 [Ignelater luminosus]